MFQRIGGRGAVRKPNSEHILGSHRFSRQNAGDSRIDAARQVDNRSGKSGSCNLAVDEFNQDGVRQLGIDFQADI